MNGAFVEEYDSLDVKVCVTAGFVWKCVDVADAEDKVSIAVDVFSVVDCTCVDFLSRAEFPVGCFNEGVDLVDIAY